MKKILFIFLLFLAFVIGFSISQISSINKKDKADENNDNYKVEVSTSIISPSVNPNDEYNNQNTYNNPIDEYFIPRINDSSLCEAEKREYQDSYRGVWKAEFENIMLWMNNKCVYQEDNDNLTAYKSSVEQLIDSTYSVVVTDWLDDYQLSPTSPERNSWGNGTRSGLNQIQAEIYRDAGMRLIDDSYSFLNKDYSKELYE